MVRARENRAEVLLTVVDSPQPGPDEGWATSQVRIEGAEPVAGWPNLLADSVGRTLTALVPTDLAHGLTLGSSWQAIGELVRPRVMRIRSAYHQSAKEAGP